MSVYYVDTAVGNDGNAGTSEGSGNAWATIDHAMNTVAAGDKVWVKASGNYNELATIDTAGTQTSPIVFEGYTSTTGDGGVATISGQSSRANCIVDNIAANTNIFYCFKNFLCTLATGDGVNTDCLSITWKNCSFSGNGTTSGDGYQGSGQFENCKFDDNSARGYNGDRSNTVLIGCRAYRNGTDGFAQTIGALIAFACEAFSNGSVGFLGGQGNNQPCILINCTVDGDAKDTTDGLKVNTAFRQINAVVNCVFYDCTVGVTGANQDEVVISRNNLVNSNTTAYSGFSTFTGEVTSAPAFNNEGANDYTPGSGSPLIAAGYDGATLEGFTPYMDIGAIQSAGAGSCDYPAAADVESGVVYASGAMTGTFTAPAVGDVESGVQYGGGGTEFTGTFGVPSQSDVMVGVQYGAGGTEFTGTLAGGGSGGQFGIRSGGSL